MRSELMLERMKGRKREKGRENWRVNVDEKYEWKQTDCVGTHGQWSLRTWPFSTVDGRPLILWKKFSLTLSRFLFLGFSFLSTYLDTVESVVTLVVSECRSGARAHIKSKFILFWFPIEVSDFEWHHLLSDFSNISLSFYFIFILFKISIFMFNFHPLYPKDLASSKHIRQSSTPLSLLRIHIIHIHVIVFFNFIDIILIRLLNVRSSPTPTWPSASSLFALRNPCHRQSAVDIWREREARRECRWRTCVFQWRVVPSTCSPFSSSSCPVQTIFCHQTGGRVWVKRIERERVENKEEKKGFLC